MLNLVLEVIVEGSRLLLCLFVLGVASINKGALHIRHFFTRKDQRKIRWTIALQNLKKKWGTILLNLLGFLLIAWLLNYLIEAAAYETCLYLTLKKGGILTASSSEWTLLLFFKNLSVIPFTLIFEVVFLLWITNQWQRTANTRFV